MMKIRIVVPGRDFRYAAKHPLDMAEVLAKHDYQVEVVCPMPSDVMPLHKGRGFRVTQLPVIASQLIPATRSIERLALSALYSLTPADITIGVDPPGFMIAHLLRKWSRSKCLVYYAMELCLPEEVPDQETVRYQAAHIRDADAVIITGKHRAEVLQERFGLAEPPIVVHNSFVLPDPICKPTLRETLVEHDFRPANQLVIFSGKLFDQHALTEVVRSMVQWPTHVGLVLVGYGDQHYVQSLLRLAVECRVSDRVYYIGPVPPDPQNILRLISGASLGLVLKKYRGGILNDVYYTPTKLFEYGAMGLPVICSDQESLRLVEEEGWGITVDVEDPADIARAVTRILCRPEQRERMGRIAHRMYVEKYCMEQQIQPLLDKLATFTENGA